MPRVLIADKLEPAGIELLHNAGIDVDNRPGLKGDDLAAALRAADAVIARSQPKITAELLADHLDFLRPPLHRLSRRSP